MESERTAFLAVVQRGDQEETELVTLNGVTGDLGGTIEMTDGTRITLTAPAGEKKAA